MASRRDELNAYTFAKKRLTAAFLQPSAVGTDEGAPRPLRAVLPGVVVGALLVAGFGAWGIFKPKVPDGWDTPVPTSSSAANRRPGTSSWRPTGSSAFTPC